jgi:hypothetical protein
MYRTKSIFFLSSVKQIKVYLSHVVVDCGDVTLL